MEKYGSAFLYAPLIFFYIVINVGHLLVIEL